MEENVRLPRQMGDVLRRERKAQGLTQQDVSDRTNLRAATISKIENGDQGVKLGTLLRVMAALSLEFRLSRRESGLEIEDIF